MDFLDDPFEVDFDGQPFPAPPPLASGVNTNRGNHYFTHSNTSSSTMSGLPDMSDIEARMREMHEHLARLQADISNSRTRIPSSVGSSYSFVGPETVYSESTMPEEADLLDLSGLYVSEREPMPSPPVSSTRAFARPPDVQPRADASPIRKNSTICQSLGKKGPWKVRWNWVGRVSIESTKCRRLAYCWDVHRRLRDPWMLSIPIERYGMTLMWKRLMGLKNRILTPLSLRKSTKRSIRMSKYYHLCAYRRSKPTKMAHLIGQRAVSSLWEIMKIQSGRRLTPLLLCYEMKAPV